MRRIQYFSALVLGFALLGACDKQSSPSQEVASQVRIEVTADGYTPWSVEAKKGEPLTLVFKRTADANCGEEVVIPDAGIRRELPPDTDVPVTFISHKTGHFAFTCGLGKMKGRIIVQ